MVKLVIISKFGEPKTVNFVSFVEENLYKKCGFRKKDHFGKRHSWKISLDKKSYYLHLYSKNTGRSTTINKYELPPPLDKELYYGSLAILLSQDKDMQHLVSLSHTIWEKIYEQLMGGFEDLDKPEKEEEEEEVEYIPDEFKTKQGYSKESGFVADDDDDMEYLTNSDDSSEDEYEFDDNDTDTSENFDADDEELKEENIKDDGEEEGNNDDNNNEEEEEEEEEEAEEDDGCDGDNELTEEEYIEKN